MIVSTDPRLAIRNFIIETFAFGEESALASDDASLLASGVLDSTDILELIVFIEESFQLEISDEEVVRDNFDSVDALTRLVIRKQIPG